jgi:hypothetical protein
MATKFNESAGPDLAALNFDFREPFDSREPFDFREPWIFPSGVREPVLHSLSNVLSPVTGLIEILSRHKIGTPFNRARSFIATARQPYPDLSRRHGKLLVNVLLSLQSFY